MLTLVFHGLLSIPVLAMTRFMHKVEPLTVEAHRCARAITSEDSARAISRRRIIRVERFRSFRRTTQRQARLAMLQDPRSPTSSQAVLRQARFLVLRPLGETRFADQATSIS